MKMFSSIALFAGSDGLAFGIEKAEFNTLACFEFDKNPAKLISDKTIYCTMWEESIGNEDFCQRDKSNNKGIGYFFRRIFQYIRLFFEYTFRLLLICMFLLCSHL